MVLFPKGRIALPSDPSWTGQKSRGKEQSCGWEAFPSPRVFPESAGDFLGEGESEQPSPGENPAAKPHPATCSGIPGVCCAPGAGLALPRGVKSHLRDVLDLLESAGCCLGVLLEEVGEAGITRC